MKTLWLWAAVFVALIGSTVAQAADMPVKARPMEPVPVWSWSGFYVGGNAGYSWGRSKTDIAFICAQTSIINCPTIGTVPFRTSRSFNLDGGLGGFQAGFNVQRGAWVFGLEGDYQWTGQKGDTGTAGFSCPAQVCNEGDALNPVIAGTLAQKLTWFSTLRARLGVAQSNWLAYVTGGFAYGSLASSGTLSGFTLIGATTSTTFAFSQRHGGWTIGGGLEAILVGNLSAKLEYLYVDLGTFSGTAPFTTAFPALNVRFDSHVTDNIVRVGLNYRFGAGPVVARY